MRHHFAIPKWFKPEKAAQAVVFFAIKAGGKINVVKLMKLLYLADREHMQQHWHPIYNDKLVSMPLGPVKSLTYNYLNGDIESEKWNEFIGERKGNDISVRNIVKVDDLLELSEAETDTMEKVWQKFRDSDRWELVGWTHEHCAEWEDPEGSSRPITHLKVLECLEVPDAQARADDIEATRRLDEISAEKSA